MKRILVNFIVSLVLVLVSFSVWGNASNITLPERFQLAMQDKKWDIANPILDSMLAYAPYQGQLWFNKGVVYYNQHLIAESIACFQKSLLLHPFNKDAQDNLQIAQSRLVDRLPNYFDFILLRWWKLLINPYFHNYWAFAALFILVVVGLCMYLPMALRTKKQFWIIKNTALFLSGCFFIMAYLSWSQLSKTTVFVVKSDKAMQYATPLSKAGKQVPYGTLVSVLKSESNWYKVALPNGIETWMQKSNLAKF